MQHICVAPTGTVKICDVSVAIGMSVVRDAVVEPAENRTNAVTVHALNILHCWTPLRGTGERATEAEEVEAEALTVAAGVNGFVSI